ncbi:MAG TPA: putative ABC exporter domain-containing protein [Gammaproteobacteria bacterium]|nr:putative ABC exporter domain-containing protein [Gammaproteobacteria bacterium]
MGRVIGALLYLRATSLKNALRSRLLRLRQPKYMVGAMVGAVYLYLVFFRRMRAGGASSAAVSLGMPADVLPLAVTLAALGLTIGAVLCWIWPRKRASLSFSEAEIGFLFPAPVSRRALIHYRLIGMQPGTLLSALIFGLISSRWSFIPGGAAIRIAGWWIVLATFALHIIGSSFVLTQLLDRGATSTRRRLSVFAMLGVAALLLTVWLRFGLVSAAGPDLSGFGPFIAHLNSLMSSGPLYWVSWPSRLVVKPMFAHDAVSFTLSLGPALFVYALHYYWVLHMNVSFE